jgi:hypothetical protein
MDDAVSRFTLHEGGVCYGARYRVEGPILSVICGSSCVYAYRSPGTAPPIELAVETLRTMIRSGLAVLRTVPEPEPMH